MVDRHDGDRRIVSQMRFTKTPVGESRADTRVERESRKETRPTTKFSRQTSDSGNLGIEMRSTIYEDWVRRNDLTRSTTGLYG